MATYYVWSGATGTNAGTSWTNAYTAFGSAVTAATSAGDVILVHYTHQENLSATASYSFGADVSVICVNKDSSNAPTEMGTNGWIGSSTDSYQITLTGGARKVYVFGLTLKNTSGGSGSFLINTSTLSHMEFEKASFIMGNGSSLSITIGPTSNTSSYTKFQDCVFKFGAVGQKIIIREGECELQKCSLDSNSSNPTTLFEAGYTSNDVKAYGCDFSVCTNTLVGSASSPAIAFAFAQCKLGANITVLGTPSTANRGSTSVYLFDCSSGDTHGLFGYYDAFGSCVSDTGIYYTTGAAAQSWKITTTANCSYYTPFVSPFVDFYNTGTSSITPYFEILRDGSTTAFQNDEVWGEFFVKTTSGSTQSTPYNDRMALLGTPANQASGAGTGSWTGEAGSAWSGKIDSGSAVTPAENGHIRGRVVVGEPSITVYVDPQIRT